jgi:hypothetical protein
MYGYSGLGASRLAGASGKVFGDPVRSEQLVEGFLLQGTFTFEDIYQPLDLGNIEPGETFPISFRP